VAAKGGGAWKVAYADFVTAMMAFFLVMWICGQDQQIRKAVSDYFGDPHALNQGISKAPYRTGAVFDTLTSGSVPQVESVSVGHGRSSYTARGENGRITKLVSDWIHADNEAWQYWREKAKRVRNLVPMPEDGDSKKAAAALEAATLQLTQRLKDEITREIPVRSKGLYQELLYDSLSVVNWREIAEDLLSD
jgi:chemotaxis protein MotB